MNHLARALAIALLLLLSLSPAFGQTPQCTTGLPAEGDTFFIDEPVTFTHATEFDVYYLDYLARSISHDTDSAIDYFMGDYSTDTLRLRVPGPYRIRRYGLLHGTASLAVCTSHFEMLGACAHRQFPPQGPDEPMPVLYLEKVPPFNYSVATMDGEVEAFQRYKIRNDGAADLIVIGVYQCFEDGLIELYAKNIDPYTRLAPGESVILDLGIQFVRPTPFPNGFEVSYSMVVESNDPDLPYRGMRVNGITFYANRESITVPIPDLPPVSPKPVCGDFNSDGVLDAGDVISHLTGSLSAPGGRSEPTPTRGAKP